MKVMLFPDTWGNSPIIRNMGTLASSLSLITTLYSVPAAIGIMARNSRQIKTLANFFFILLPPNNTIRHLIYKYLWQIYPVFFLLRMYGLKLKIALGLFFP